MLPLKQGCNPTIPIPTVLGRQLDHPPHEATLITRNLRLPPLGRTLLAQHLTSPTLRYSVTSHCVADVLDCVTPFRRAQKFPEAASFRISMSKA